MQRIHILWTLADLLNYKTLLLLLSEDPAQFIGRLVAVYNPTSRDPEWLLKGILPAHDYAIVIKQARRCPGENPPHRRNGWLDPLPEPLQVTRKWLCWRLSQGLNARELIKFSSESELVKD